MGRDWCGPASWTHTSQVHFALRTVGLLEVNAMRSSFKSNTLVVSPRSGRIPKNARFYGAEVGSKDLKKYVKKENRRRILALDCYGILEP